MTKLIEFLSGTVGALVIIAALLSAGVKFAEFILKQLKIYVLLLEFIWHQNSIRQWLKQNCDKSAPAITDEEKGSKQQ